MQSGWEKRPTQSKETLLVLSFLPLQFCNWSVHSRGWSNVPDCEQDPRKNPDQKMFPGSQEKFYFEHERCKKANFSLYRRTGEKIKVNLYDCLNFLSLIIVGANHILWRAGRGKPRTPRWDQTLTWEGREESCSHPSHTKEGPEKKKVKLRNTSFNETFIEKSLSKWAWTGSHTRRTVPVQWWPLSWHKLVTICANNREWVRNLGSISSEYGGQRPC